MSVHVETIELPVGQSFRLLRWRDNLHDVEQFDAVGRAVPLDGAGERWHLHREMELTLIECGNGLRIVGDHVAAFAGPELVLLGPHLPHCWHGLHHSTGFSVQFQWPLEHPLRLLPEFAELRRLWDDARRGLLFAGPTRERVSRRLAVMPGLPAAARLGLLVQVLAELAAAPGQVTALSGLDFSVREGARHQAGIERAICCILERFSEPLTGGEIVRLAGMSKATFEREFSRYTGTTFTAFLNRVRLGSARQRLIESDEFVSSIAFAVGFNNLSHFNRLYRRAYGTAPSADRPLVKESNIVNPAQ